MEQNESSLLEQRIVKIKKAPHSGDVFEDGENWLDHRR